MQWEQRSSPVSVLLTPPAPFHLEEALSRAEARQLAVAMAARGLQERLEAANREAAASEAAAARFRRLQRDVADEQRSRARSRGRRPRSSPLSGVHAMLMWASSRRRGSPRQQQRKSARRVAAGPAAPVAAATSDDEAPAAADGPVPFAVNHTPRPTDRPLPLDFAWAPRV